MVKQRTNWFRSLGAVRCTDGKFTLTDDGLAFSEAAVKDGLSCLPRPLMKRRMESLGIYETTVQTRSVNPEFRATVLFRYESICPVSGVDHPELLDVAHVLQWRRLSESPS